MNRMRTQKGNRRGERGSVLAISAVGMLTFLLAVGLGVDISRFYLAQAELQNAADAAALAGASALNADDGGITNAANRAVQQMNTYEFSFRNVVIPRENVRFSRNMNGPYVNEQAARGDAVNIRFVEVVVPPTAVGVTFASMVLGPSQNLTARATAGMSVPLNNFCDWIPVTAIDSESRFFMPGNMYTIRRPPGGAVTPGNYQILAVDGPGGSDDRLGLAGGVKNCVGAGSIVQTKPGVSAGAVRQGINARFGEYSGNLSSSAFPPDTNVREGITYQQYLDAQNPATRNASNFEAPNRGGDGIPNRRVVLIPLIKESEFNNGRDEVRIDRFAAFFLRSKVGGGNGGDIQAEYIGLRVVLGRGGFDPNGGTVSPELTIPVLYK